MEYENSCFLNLYTFLEITRIHEICQNFYIFSLKWNNNFCIAFCIIFFFLRLYECELGDSPKLIRNWKVGPTPSASSTKIIPNVESLGETAVDFDFVTPTMKLDDNYQGNSDFHKIQWPILVLRGDGDVLIVHGNILSGKYVTWICSFNYSSLTPKLLKG